MWLLITENTAQHFYIYVVLQKMYIVKKNFENLKLYLYLIIFNVKSLIIK